MTRDGLYRASRVPAAARFVSFLVAANAYGGFLRHHSDTREARGFLHYISHDARFRFAGAPLFYIEMTICWLRHRIEVPR